MKQESMVTKVIGEIQALLSLPESHNQPDNHKAWEAAYLRHNLAILNLPDYDPEPIEAILTQVLQGKTTQEAALVQVLAHLDSEDC